MNRLNMVMWPKTIWPSAVAGPVAAKALQCSGWGGVGAASWGSRKRAAFEPVGRGLKRAVEEVDLDLGVDRHQVERGRAAGP